MRNEAIDYVKSFGVQKSSAVYLKLEFWALLILIICLPLTEAGKNIFIGVYLLLWLFNRARGLASWGGAWTAWESICLAVFLTALASCLWGAAPPDKGILSLYGTVSYVTLFTAIRRSRFSEQQVQQFFIVAVAATLLTLCWGYWALLVSHSTYYLKLNSVGHVNQGAIYLAIILTSALTWVFCTPTHKKLLWAVCFILWISLLLTEARGAILPIVAFVGFYVFYKIYPDLVAILRNLSLLAVVAIVTIKIFPGIVTKTAYQIDAINSIGSYRVDIVKAATLAAMNHPIFGMGVTNFDKITPALVTQWMAQHPLIGPIHIMKNYSHSHNFYFNTLAEQGILGLTAMLAWVVFMGICLFKWRPQTPGMGLRDLTWGSALGAWVIVMMGGFFNTTLLHEHGMIAIMLWALWLSYIWQRKPAPQLSVVK